MDYHSLANRPTVARRTFENSEKQFRPSRRHCRFGNSFRSSSTNCTIPRRCIGRVDRAKSVTLEIAAYIGRRVGAFRFQQARLKTARRTVHARRKKPRAAPKPYVLLDSREIYVVSDRSPLNAAINFAKSPGRGCAILSVRRNCTGQIKKPLINRRAI